MEQHLAHFPVRPDPGYLEEWLGHILETGQPETFRSVSTSRPPRDSMLVLLTAEINVPCQKRPGSALVPCPLCSGHSPKFKKGYPAWFPDEQVVRFIGHICGRKYFSGGQFDKALAELKIEMQYRASVVFLEKNYEIVAEMQTCCHSMGGVAKSCQATHNHLWKHETIRVIASYAQREEWALYVDEKVPSRSSLGIDYINTRTRIGVLRGKQALSKIFSPAIKLRKIESVLKEIAEKLPRWRQLDKSELVDVVTGVRKCNSNLTVISDDLHDFREFFDSDNLRLLETWARHSSSRVIINEIYIRNQPHKQLCMNPGFIRVEIPDAMFGNIDPAPALI